MCHLDRVEDLNVVSVVDIQKTYTKRIQRTVHHWSIRGVSIKHTKNSFGGRTIYAETRLVDRMMEEKKIWE